MHGEFERLRSVLLIQIGSGDRAAGARIVNGELENVRRKIRPYYVGYVILMPLTLIVILASVVLYAMEIHEPAASAPAWLRYFWHYIQIAAFGLFFTLCLAFPFADFIPTFKKRMKCWMEVAAPQLSKAMDVFARGGFEFYIDGDLSKPVPDSLFSSIYAVLLAGDSDSSTWMGLTRAGNWGKYSGAIYLRVISPLRRLSEKAHQAGEGAKLNDNDCPIFEGPERPTNPSHDAGGGVIDSNESHLKDETAATGITSKGKMPRCAKPLNKGSEKYVRPEDAHWVLGVDEDQFSEFINQAIRARSWEHTDAPEKVRIVLNTARASAERQYSEHGRVTINDMVEDCVKALQKRQAEVPNFFVSLSGKQGNHSKNSTAWIESMLRMSGNAAYSEIRLLAVQFTEAINRA